MGSNGVDAKRTSEVAQLWEGLEGHAVSCGICGGARAENLRLGLILLSRRRRGHRLLEFLNCGLTQWDPMRTCPQHVDRVEEGRLIFGRTLRRTLPIVNVITIIINIWRALFAMAGVNVYVEEGSQQGFPVEGHP